MTLKRTFTIMLGLVLALGLNAQAATWNLDKAHSSVGFKVSHMVISKVNGNFDDFTATITNFDGENLKDASVEATVQMASIDTDDEERDAHLRSADFFEVEKYPTMTFKSTNIEPGENNTFEMTGDLTIKGITKQVTFAGEFNGVLNDPWGNTRAGFAAVGTIDRKDFNITWSKTLDGGGLVVGDEVEIMLEAEAIKAQ